MSVHFHEGRMDAAYGGGEAWGIAACHGGTAPRAERVSGICAWGLQGALGRRLVFPA